MAYTDIDKPTDYFNTNLWTGDGTSGRNITGVGFQPDWVWIKNRDNGARYHTLNDSVRGVNKQLFSNVTNAEETDTEQLQAFISDGFTVGNNANTNENTSGFVSWSWLASNTTASNTDGSITSTVSANTTSGFSIVSYTGTGSNATVGHGLSSAPAFYVVKSRDSAYDWRAYHQGIGATKYLNLNQTIAATTASNAWNDTAPTSSVFSLGSGSTVNQSGDDFIAFCFSEKKGFSKFGSYVGNSSTDGTFVYTGFKPAWVMIKKTSGADDWVLFDNKRDSFNVTEKILFANSSGAEATNFKMDLLSNGFKLKTTDGKMNSSNNYIYMSFASNPFVTSTGIPTVAR